MIRHYDEMGLIPAPSRPASEHRVYCDDDVRRISFIARARGLGLEMAEIAGFMVTWGGDRHRATAADWRVSIVEKSAELNAIAGELEH